MARLLRQVEVEGEGCAVVCVGASSRIEQIFVSAMDALSAEDRSRLQY